MVSFRFPFSFLNKKKRPDLLHPFASAIDSPPLEPPEQLVRLLSSQEITTKNGTRG